MDIPSEQPLDIQESSLPLFFCSRHPKFQLSLVCTDTISCTHPGLVCAICIQESHLTHSVCCLSDIISQCSQIYKPILLAQKGIPYQKIEEISWRNKQNKITSPLAQLDKAVENTLEIFSHCKAKINQIFHQLESALKDHVVLLRKQAFSSLGDVGEMLKFIHQPIDVKDTFKEQRKLQQQLRKVLQKTNKEHNNYSLDNVITQTTTTTDITTISAIYNSSQIKSQQNKLENDQINSSETETQSIFHKDGNLTQQEYFEQLVYKVTKTLNDQTKLIQPLDEYVCNHIEGLEEFQCQVKITIDSLIEQTASLLHACQESNK